MQLLNMQFYPLFLLSLVRSISLSTLFLNALSLRSSLNVLNQVAQPYKATCEIRSVYINPYAFSLATQDENTFERIVASIPNM